MLYLTEEEKDERFMMMALEEARKAFDEDEIPVGAVVVCNDRVIARGHNRTESLTDVTAHAEMMAITSAAANLGGKYLTDCTLYVTVEPCLMCAGAIAWAQIGRLVYGAPDDKRGAHTYFSSSVLATPPLHPRTRVTTGVLADECAALMKDFFRCKRR